MPALSGDFIFSSETSDVVGDFITMLDSNWDTDSGGTKPTIVNVMNYRSVDLQNKEYVLIGLVEDYDDFSGVGGMEFKRHVILNLQIKTGSSRDRATEILDECRRILRSVEYWGSYRNLLLTTAVDLSDRLRKVYSYNFVIVGDIYENV